MQENIIYIILWLPIVYSRLRARPGVSRTDFIRQDSCRVVYTRAYVNVDVIFFLFHPTALGIFLEY